MASKRLFWKDDPKLEKNFLVFFILLLTFALIGIWTQFEDKAANAYGMLGILILVGYVGGRSNLPLVWQGLGTRKRVAGGIGLGILGFALTEGSAAALNLVIVNVPFAIAAGVVFDFFYRVVVASIFEEAAFRSFLYPTLKGVFGNQLSAALASSTVWAILFHVAVLGGDVQNILFLIPVGVIYAYINDRAQSSIPSYTAHFINNFVKVVIRGG